MASKRTGRVDGRRVVVTGAASGIGLATTRLLLQEGAKVAMLDRNEAAGKEGARPMGDGVRAFTVDVANQEQVCAAVAQAAEFLGGIDGVVNGAGVSMQAEFATLSSVDWHATMDVNLSGPFYVCQAALPFLQSAGRGTIVNISSGVALRPIAQSTAYAASKGGLIAFGKALAIELAPANIRVNTVCPGIVETPMIRRRIERAPDPQREQDKLFERRLLKRFGEPEEIAHAVLFLTADDCAYATGSVFAIDGGGTMY
jgi:NAD(P)-dependent dehydrogenase (short-subunit alcohol dehydrogenase family)